jgi:hypothetical protein
LPLVSNVCITISPGFTEIDCLLFQHGTATVRHPEQIEPFEGEDQLNNV